MTVDSIRNSCDTILFRCLVPLPAFHVNLPDPEERVGLGEEGRGVPGLDELHLHPLLLLLHVQIIQVG